MALRRVFNIHGHLHHHDNLDERIKLWRTWGVEKFCCLCMHERWKTVSQGRYFTNEDFVALGSRYSDILIGMAHVNLFASEMDRPEDLDRYREQGFAGLKCIDTTYPYNHEAYFPLYERAEQLQMPILFHTGLTAPLMEENSDAHYGINAENLRPYCLDKIARSFPKLKIIGAHLGKPHFHEAMALLRMYPNVYYDFCGGGGGRLHVNMIKRIFEPFEPDHLDDPESNPALTWFRNNLVFGTDNAEPDVWIPHAEHIMDYLQIPEESRTNFFWNTAAGIFGLPR